MPTPGRLRRWAETLPQANERDDDEAWDAGHVGQDCHDVRPKNERVYGCQEGEDGKECHPGLEAILARKQLVHVILLVGVGGPPRTFELEHLQ